MTASTSPSAPTIWPTLLERVLVCPQCKSSGVGITGATRCPSCGFEAEPVGDIPSMVQTDWLHGGHEAEQQAQSAAVESYYENEARLTCHWDRLSAEDLPALLGWPSGLVLDLGCGTGTAGAALRRAGAHVIGADLSPACLAVARRRLDEVVRVDATRLPFADASFDAIVSRGCLHHLDDAEQSLAEARRVLKPGARAVFIDPREWAWLEPIKAVLRRTDDAFTHEHHAYTPEEYRALIGAHFDIEQETSSNPFAVLVAHGLDLLPLPSAVPHRGLAKALLGLDRTLDRTPLRKAGHLLTVVARNR